MTESVFRIELLQFRFKQWQDFFDDHLNPCRIRMDTIRLVQSRVERNPVEKEGI